MKQVRIRSLTFIVGVGVLATLVQTGTIWGQQAAQPAPIVTPTVMSHDYTRTHSFPNIFDSFMSLPVPQPGMANSPRLKDLIRDGKLWLSLQDAIALALENNLDIDVRAVPDTESADGLSPYQGRFCGTRRDGGNDLECTVRRGHWLDLGQRRKWVEYQRRWRRLFRWGPR